MNNVNVSVFASAVRPKLWDACLSSLSSTSCSFEVVFGGFNTPEEVKPFIDKYPFFRYIHTSNIKPAQVYEVSRRNAIGECVIWVADDCEFPNDVVGKAYKYWKSQGNEKLILSVQTKETGYNLPIGKFFNMKNHSFFGFRPETPLMAPLGFMSRKFLDSIGGLDRRYICGQYENDIIMRALVAGGVVEIFGGEDCFIDIDHLGKSLLIGESKVEQDFLNRPFARGYLDDRVTLETSWVKGKAVSMERNDAFEGYEDVDLLTKSQGPRGIWE
jgi:hypothetical protein